MTDKSRAAAQLDILNEALAGRDHDFKAQGRLRVPLLQLPPAGFYDLGGDPDSCPAHEVYTFELGRGTYFISGNEHPARWLQCDGLIIDAWYYDEDCNAVQLDDEIGKPAP